MIRQEKKRIGKEETELPLFTDDMTQQVHS